MSWRWITKSALMLLHGESLATHGGGEGLRDEGLLDATLARPLNLLANASADAPPDMAALAALAASYTVSLAKTTLLLTGTSGRRFWLQVCFCT